MKAAFSWEKPKTIVNKANPKEILAHQRQTAMVFQNYALFHNKTARENIVIAALADEKKDQAGSV